MIGHYLSSNNEMCYSIKTNNFSPTKQGHNDFSSMLQIRALLRCFATYEKDDGVKLLIMKVSDTTLLKTP